MGFCFDFKRPAQGWNIRRERAPARSLGTQCFRIREKSFARASLMSRFFIDRFVSGAARRRCQRACSIGRISNSFRGGEQRV